MLKSFSPILMIIIFFTIFSVKDTYGARPCRPRPEKDEEVFHFNWIGRDISPEHIGKIVNFCSKTSGKKNIKIYIWHEGNISKDSQKRIRDQAGGSCTGLISKIEFNNVQGLFKPKSEQKEIIRKGYDDFKELGIWAGASDLLRPLMLKNYGGCYFDIGFDFTQFLDQILETPTRRRSRPAEFYVTEAAVSFGGKKLLPGQEGPTQFYNNNFMAAPLESPTVNLLITHIADQIKLINDNHVLKNFLILKDDHFSSLGALFQTTGPLAFNRGIGVDARDKDSDAERVVRLQLVGLKYGGKASWNRMAEDNPFRYFFAQCISLELGTNEIFHCFGADFKDFSEKDACMYDYVKKVIRDPIKREKLNSSCDIQMQSGGEEFLQRYVMPKFFNIINNDIKHMDIDVIFTIRNSASFYLKDPKYNEFKVELNKAFKQVKKVLSQKAKQILVEESEKLSQQQKYLMLRHILYNGTTQDLKELLANPKVRSDDEIMEYLKSQLMNPNARFKKEELFQLMADLMQGITSSTSAPSPGCGAQQSGLYFLYQTHDGQQIWVPVPQGEPVNMQQMWPQLQVWPHPPHHMQPPMVWPAPIMPFQNPHGFPMVPPPLAQPLPPDFQSPQK